MDWNGKPYHSLDYELKKEFGGKIYKLALESGCTCPNRDGTLGTGGCLFCSQGGSGDFSVPLQDTMGQQIQLAKERVSGKMPPDGRYIAYFQSYTNTYGPVSRLEPMFTEAIRHPDIAGLSIGTRPDCLEDPMLQMLARLNQEKPVWVELGLQTVHDTTARLIRRGYPLSTFTSAWRRLRDAGLTVIVHVILGLPGETREMMLDTIHSLSSLDWPQDGACGVKLQLLHVLKGTDLAVMYQNHPFPVLSLEEYTDLVIDCIELLPPEAVIHRISGDGPKDLLIAPLWSANKRLVLNTMAKRFRERNAWQGRLRAFEC